MSGILGHHGLLLAGSGWSPDQLPVPPKIWLDDESAVTNVSGSASQWNDRSGNGNHFLQATSGFRPQILASDINGRRAIRFDGSDDRMYCVSAQTVLRNVTSAWVFAVVKKRGTDGAGTSMPSRGLVQFNRGDFSHRFGCLISNNSAAQYNLPFAAIRPVDGVATIETQYSSTLVNGRYAIVSTYWDGIGSALSMGVDGASLETKTPLSTASTTSNTLPHSSNPSHLGCNASGGAGFPVDYTAFADIDLAALLVGSGSLPSTDDRQRLEGWAAWRYGLQSSLPSGHPYKTSPP